MSMVLLLKNCFSVYNEKPKVGFRLLDEFHFVLLIGIYHPALVKEIYMKNPAPSQAILMGKTN